MGDKLFDTDWRTIRVQRREAMVEVALARPGARNALNGELMEELTEAAALLRLRTDVRAVILTGADSYFSAGADLSASQARTALPLIESRRAVMAARERIADRRRGLHCGRCTPAVAVAPGGLRRR